MRRLATWFMLSALAVVALVLLWTSDGPRDAAEPDRRPPTHGPTSSTELAGPTGAQAESDPARSPRAAVENQHASSTVRVEGRLVVLDDAGVEFPSLAGTIALSLGDPMGSSTIETPVRDGRFTLEARRRAVIGLAHGRLGDRPIALDLREDAERLLPDDGRIELRVRWIPEVRLHVRDAITNSAVREVEVGVARGNSAHARASRDPESLRASGTLATFEDSPVRLDATRMSGAPSPCRAHVRAPGYAWAVAEIDLARDGAVFVDLVPGVTLDVDASELADETPIFVRVAERDGAEPIRERGLGADRTTSFEGVPIGAWIVTAERAVFPSLARPVARAEVETRAGARARVKLTRLPPPATPMARISGVLRLPREWDARAPSLRLHALGELAAHDTASVDARLEPRVETGAFDSFAWSIEAAPVGRGVLVIDPARFTRFVDVPAGGLEGLTVDVPIPVDVRVRLVDARTLAPLRIAGVEWSCSVTESLARELGRTISVSSHGLDVTTIRAPLGELTIRARAVEFGYPITAKTGEARARQEDWVIPLEKHARVAVRMEAAGGTLRFETGVEVQVTTMDGRRVEVDRRDDTETHRVLVEAPGRHRVSLTKAPAGFVLPPPFDVTLSDREILPLVFTLQRGP